MFTNVPRLCITVGCMFSGKSEDIARRVHIYQIAGARVGVFKPSTDTRGVDFITCHKGTQIPATTIPNENPAVLLKYLDCYDVYVIDEAQFFTEALIRVVRKLFLRHIKNVFVYGLTHDFTGQPFGYLPMLLSIPGCQVEQLYAICTRCNAVEEAVFSHRYVPTKEKEGQIHIGGDESYQPLCLQCALEINAIQI